MFESVVPWLTQYGYVGVALGVFLESTAVPIPAETVLLGAAFAAAQGALSLPLVIAVAAVAGVLGDNVGYVLGRNWGRTWVERHGRWILLSPLRLHQADLFFQRFGPVAVALARFVAGVRVIAAFAAGTSRMRWPTFLAFNVIGAVSWSVVVGVVGYTFGKSWQSLGQWAGAAGTALALLAAAALFATWFFRRAGRRRAVAHRSLHALAWREMWVVAISLAAVGVFARVAEDVASRDTAPFDGAVRAWALAHHNQALSWAFGVITLLGSWTVLVPVAGAAVWWLWRRNAARVAAAVVVAPLGAAGLILWLKYEFERSRPPGAAALGGLNYSFPSGQTTAMTAVGLGVCYVLLRERLIPRWSLPLAAAVAGLVGASRIYLDAHWATDVIGGWAVGLFVATGCAALYEWLRVRVRRPAVARG